MKNLVKFRETYAARIARPVVMFLSKTPISPTIVTVTGFFITLAAAVLIGLGFPVSGGILVVFGSIFDMFDGALARYTNRVTAFGGILDSTLDRLSEVAILLGILVLYAGQQWIVGILLVGLAIPGSLMVSYLRARAEAARLECKEGLFTRTERVVVLSLGLLLSGITWVLPAALGIIVVFSFFTVFQRLYYIYRQLKMQ